MRQRIGAVGMSPTVPVDSQREQIFFSELVEKPQASHTSGDGGGLRLGGPLGGGCGAGDLLRRRGARARGRHGGAAPAEKT